MRSTTNVVRVDAWESALAAGAVLGGAQYGGAWAPRDMQPSLVGVDDALRARLAQHWTQLGLAAHASIAAYARLALQLLSFGAPPELLSRTQSAMTDRTRHARHAFAIATHCDGRAVGPGKLPIESGLDEDDVDRIARGLIVDGCLGAASASAEAQDTLEHVTDPVLGFVLRELARDGSEHALLAWRSLIWLSDAFAQQVTPVLEQAIAGLRGALAARPRPEVTAAEEAWLASGYVAPAVRERARRTIVERSLLGGLAALLTGAPAPSSADRGRLTLV